LFGAENKYFVHALVDDANQFVQRAYYHTAERKLFAIVEGPSIQDITTWQVGFYVGPNEEGFMTAVDPRLEQTLDYSGWLAPIAKAALAVLKWLYSYLHNYGLAIIVLTILMKLVLLPFTWHAERGNKQRQEFQKKLNYLQQKYKHDKELLARERADLIRKHGMPGLSGCLPLLLQIPVFFALNKVLSSALELYQAPFMLWIHDLSARDPYYVLPLLIVLTMLLQAFSVDSQQRFAVMAMALVFGAVATNFAAGLSLYIFVSTLLSVIQTMAQRQFKLGV
jgi:YidC/Oxa1 family membrane protein insertase